MAASSGWSTGVMALDLPRKNWATWSFVMVASAAFGFTTTTTSASAGTEAPRMAAATAAFKSLFMARSLENEVDRHGADGDIFVEAWRCVQQQAAADCRLDAVDLRLQGQRAVEVPTHADRGGARLALAHAGVRQGVGAGAQCSQLAANGRAGDRAGGRHDVGHGAVDLELALDDVWQELADAVAAHHVPRAGVVDVGIDLALGEF